MNTLFPTLRTGKVANSDGYRTLPTLSSWIDELINDPFNADMVSNFNTGITLPAVNVVENEKSFKVEMAIPGFKKSDFKIDLDKNILSISSETRNEKEETNEKFTRREFGYSTFKRTFHIPETVNTDGINAQYTDGILTVDLPKKEEAIDKGVKQIEVL